MKPNFKNIDINSISNPVKDNSSWDADNNIIADWKTPEQVDIKPVYTSSALDGMDRS